MDENLIESFVFETGIVVIVFESNPLPQDQIAAELEAVLCFDSEQSCTAKYVGRRLLSPTSNNKVVMDFKPDEPLPAGVQVTRVEFISR